MSFTVTSGANAGLGTLRQAFLDAGVGPATITINSGLVITLTSSITSVGVTLTIIGSGPTRPSIVTSGSVIGGTNQFVASTDCNISFDNINFIGNGTISSRCMLFQNSSIAITNSSFSSFVQTTGGACISILASDGTAITCDITDTDFSNNTTQGCVVITSSNVASSITGTLTNLTFTNNLTQTATLNINSTIGTINLTCSNLSFDGSVTQSGQGVAIWLSANSGSSLVIPFDQVTITNASHATSNPVPGAIGVSNQLAAGSVITTTFSNMLLENNSVTPFIMNPSATSIFTTTISDSVFNNNTSILSGGAIRIYGPGTSNVNLIDCTISNNDASSGAGIFSTTTAGLVNLDITSTTFNNNISTASGGAIFIDALSPTTLDLTNSTIANNAAVTAGAIFTNGTVTSTLTNNTIASNSTGISNTSTSFSLFNTIVANNNASDASGTFDALSGNNLIGVDTGLVGITNGVNSNQVGTAIAPIDPVLDPLANNGGTTETMAETFTSPSVNAGLVSYATNAGLTTDQRGFPRTFDGQVDIGSFELQALVCFRKDTEILVRDIESNIEEVIAIDKIFSNRHLVFDTSSDSFIPIRINIITGMAKSMTLIKANLFGEGKPDRDLYVTPGHTLLVDGEKIKAKYVKGARTTKCELQLVYSICTDSQIPIIANGIEALTWGYEEWITNSEEKGLTWKDNK